MNTLVRDLCLKSPNSTYLTELQTKLETLEFKFNKINFTQITVDTYALKRQESIEKESNIVEEEILNLRLQEFIINQINNLKTLTHQSSEEICEAIVWELPQILEQHQQNLNVELLHSANLTKLENHLKDVRQLKSYFKPQSNEDKKRIVEEFVRNKNKLSDAELQSEELALLNEIRGVQSEKLIAEGSECLRLNDAEGELERKLMNVKFNKILMSSEYLEVVSSMKGAVINIDKILEKEKEYTVNALKTYEKSFQQKILRLNEISALISSLSTEETKHLFETITGDISNSMQQLQSEEVELCAKVNEIRTEILVLESILDRTNKQDIEQNEAELKALQEQHKQIDSKLMIMELQKMMLLNRNLMNQPNNFTVEIQKVFQQQENTLKSKLDKVQKLVIRNTPKIPLKLKEISKSFEEIDLTNDEKLVIVHKLKDYFASMSVEEKTEFMKEIQINYNNDEYVGDLDDLAETLTKEMHEKSELSDIMMIETKLLNTKLKQLAIARIEELTEQTETDVSDIIENTLLIIIPNLLYDQEMYLKSCLDDTISQISVETSVEHKRLVERAQSVVGITKSQIGKIARSFSVEDRNLLLEDIFSNYGNHRHLESILEHEGELDDVNLIKTKIKAVTLAKINQIPNITLDSIEEIFEDVLINITNILEKVNEIDEIFELSPLNYTEEVISLDKLESYYQQLTQEQQNKLIEVIIEQIDNPNNLELTQEELEIQKLVLKSNKGDILNVLKETKSDLKLKNKIKLMNEVQNFVENLSETQITEIVKDLMISQDLTALTSEEQRLINEINDIKSLQVPSLTETPSEASQLDNILQQTEDQLESKLLEVKVKKIALAKISEIGDETIEELYHDAVLSIPGILEEEKSKYELQPLVLSPQIFGLTPIEKIQKIQEIKTYLENHPTKPEDRKKLLIEAKELTHKLDDVTLKMNEARSSIEVTDLETQANQTQTQLLENQTKQLLNKIPTIPMLLKALEQSEIKVLTQLITPEIPLIEKCLKNPLILTETPAPIQEGVVEKLLRIAKNPENLIKLTEMENEKLKLQNEIVELKLKEILLSKNDVSELPGILKALKLEIQNELELNPSIELEDQLGDVLKMIEFVSNENINIKNLNYLTPAIIQDLISKANVEINNLEMKQLEIIPKLEKFQKIYEKFKSDRLKIQIQELQQQVQSRDEAIIKYQLTQLLKPKLQSLESKLQELAILEATPIKPAKANLANQESSLKNQIAILETQEFELCANLPEILTLEQQILKLEDQFNKVEHKVTIVGKILELTENREKDLTELPLVLQETELELKKEIETTDEPTIFETKLQEVIEMQKLLESETNLEILNLCLQSELSQIESDLNEMKTKEFDLIKPENLTEIKDLEKQKFTLQNQLAEIQIQNLASNLPNLPPVLVKSKIRRMISTEKQTLQFLIQELHRPQKIQEILNTKSPQELQTQLSKLPITTLETSKTIPEIITEINAITDQEPSLNEVREIKQLEIQKEITKVQILETQVKEILLEKVLETGNSIQETYLNLPKTLKNMANYISSEIAILEDNVDNISSIEHLKERLAVVDELDSFLVTKPELDISDLVGGDVEQLIDILHTEEADLKAQINDINVKEIEIIGSKDGFDNLLRLEKEKQQLEETLVGVQIKEAVMEKAKEFGIKLIEIVAMIKQTVPVEKGKSNRIFPLNE